MKARVVIREAIASTHALRISCAIVVAITAVAMVSVIVVFSQVRHERMETDELVESRFMRTVHFASNDSQALTWEADNAVTALSSVEHAWMSSETFDVVNANLPSAGRASAQEITGSFDDLPMRIVAGRQPNPRQDGLREAIVSLKAAKLLGFGTPGGAIERPGLQQWAVVGVFEPLHEGLPAQVLMATRHETPPTRLSVELERGANKDRSIRHIAQLVSGAGQELVIDDPRSDRSLMTSLRYNSARSAIVVLGSVFTAALLLNGLIGVLVTRSRRLEFGRRRALGFSRRMVIGLIGVQSAYQSSLGVVLGAAIGLIYHSLVRAPELQMMIFSVLVGATMIASAAILQLPAALMAAFADPVRVLRTP